MTESRKRYTEPITPGSPPSSASRDLGLRCSKCSCRHFRVIYTRPARAGRIKRRRECRHCGKRVTTVETETTNDTEAGDLQ